MANRARTKVSRDVATDERSMDSLSFASLMCVHEQQKKPPPKNGKQDTDFEFCSVSLNSTKLDHQGRVQANISVCNSRILHKELLLQSKQSQGASPAHSGVLLQDYLGQENSSCHKDRGRVNNPRKGNQKEQNASNADIGSSSSGFSQRPFISFISPCRECHASNPAVKKPKKVNKERSH